MLLKFVALTFKVNLIASVSFIVFLNTVRATCLPAVIAHIDCFTIYGDCLNVCLLQWTVTSLKARTLLTHLSLVGSVLWARKVNSWRRFLSLHSASTGFSTQSGFTDLIACHQFPDCLSSPTLYFWTPLDHRCLYLYYGFCSWKISSLYLIIFSYYFGWVRFN